MIEKISTVKIANFCEVNKTTILRWLKKYEISVRLPPTNQFGENNPMYGMRGCKSPTWQGGKKSLYETIRNCSKYKEWRKLVFKRDNYTCQLCGDNKGGNLNADHIVPFAMLLQKYNVNNFEIAENCQALWDINNGRTLCIKCHYKTKTFGEGTKKLLRKRYE